MYDVIVVGAGPAGLSAARTAARLGFRTLVLERLPHAGHSAHPCSGVLSPVPGFVSGRRMFDGLFFPSLDLLVPSSLVIGYPTVQRFISPGGYEFRANLAAGSEFPAAVVDKPGLLRHLAGQAASAGAELHFGAAVSGLQIVDERVVGVKLGDEVLRCQVVLAAEGTSRRLTQQAGLYQEDAPRGHTLLVGYDLEAPGVSKNDLGQIVTFGARYTSASRMTATVVMATPGKASVYLTIFSDGLHATPQQLGWFYLDEYLQRDNRVRKLLAGAQIVGRWQRDVALWEVPDRVVRDGMIGLGDSITPGGHLGILPSIYLGRQAALATAEAIDGGDVDSLSLSTYEALLRGSILPNLSAESRLTACLTQMSDEELDRLSQALNLAPTHTPFFSNWRTLTWEMMGWMVKQLPSIVQNWQSMEQVMVGRGSAARV